MTRMTHVALFVSILHVHSKDSTCTVKASLLSYLSQAGVAALPNIRMVVNPQVIAFLTYHGHKGKGGGDSSDNQVQRH